MKRAQKALLIILSVIILSAGSLYAETVPMLINYKGRIYHEDILWNGPGYFKFAIVNTTSTADTITAATYWSNDGTSDCSTGDADLCEPDSAVRVPVNEGVFYIKLGDTGITNMSPITKAAFSDDITYIRVWFSISETDQFELLEPDRQIVSVPYAIYSETSETANQLVNTGADSGLDADTVDGLHATDLDESGEIDADIAAHVSNASAHHSKTTSFTELTDKISDTQIPDEIARDNEIMPAGTDNWVNTTGDTITGDLTVQGIVNATTFKGDGSQLTGIAGAGGVANTGTTTIGADTDSDGVGEIVLQTRGNTRMTVGNNGNVGIGTGSPVAKLDVANVINPTVEDGNGNCPAGYIHNDINSDGLEQNGECWKGMVVNEVGNIGIGTMSPGSELEVTGDIMVSGTVDGRDVFADGRKLDGITAGAADTTDDSWQGTGDVYTTSGNVGIGTTSPGSKLEVNGIVKATSFTGDGSGLTNLPEGMLGTTIESGEITDGEVKTEDIANGAVNSAKIADGAVTQTKIGANAVNSGKISDGTITNADIADNAAIAGTKINPNFGNQEIVTTGNISVTGTVDGRDISADGAKLNGIATGAADTTDDSWQGTGDVYTTSGNVGIGTTSPGSKLEVNGIVKATSFTGDGSGLTNLPEGMLGTTIESGEITDGEVKTEDIANGAVNSAKIADGQVTTADIADGTITNADIADNAAIAGTKINPDFGNQEIVTTGNISVTGTVDGRDIAADGTNLDGIIAAGAKDTTDDSWQGTGNVYTTSGNVGIGTTSPQSKLDVRGGDIHIQNDDILKNNNFGTIEFARPSGKSGSPIAIRQADNCGSTNNLMPCLAIDLNGTDALEIVKRDAGPVFWITGEGSIYQRGIQLHADYVFEPDYNLESIDEHSEFMWENKHLKAIPKAKTDSDGQEIVEVGAHRKGIVEELEKAHIYIEQLNKQNKKLQQHLKTLEKRLAKIEEDQN